MGDVIRFPVERTKRQHERNVEIAKSVGGLEPIGGPCVEVLVGAGVTITKTSSAWPITVTQGNGIVGRIRP